MKFKTLSTIRRSLKGDETRSKPPPRASAPAAAMIPPKRVIRALYDFNAETPHELSFREGDFFHVIGNENDPDWFEAYNPLTNARGMVPVAFFQILGKNAAEPPPPMPNVPGSGSGGGGYQSDGRNSRSSQSHQQQQQPQQYRHTTGSAGSGNRPYSNSRTNSQASGGGMDRPRPPKREPLYGVMLYDFNPERSDELKAQEGDAVVIIAQSNEEWFIAMHPGKLGGPGLIPVAFVEIRDPETGKAIEGDLESWMYAKNIQLPGVEEWKRMQEGKGSSRTEDIIPASRGASQAFTSSLAPHMRDVTSGGVSSTLVQDDQYWFHIQLWMRDGSERTVYRLYEDFYNFQLNLLETFPVEAGRTDVGERILPYMPGPLSFVNDIITEQRRAGLDQYVKELLELPPHIRECELMHAFFGLLEEEEDAADGGVEEPVISEKEMLRAVATGERPNDLFSTYGPIPGSEALAGVVPSRVSDANLTRTATPPVSGGASSSLMKIKVQWGEDILAIRVPARVTYGGLWDRVRDRIGFTVRRLEWKDLNGQFHPLDDGEDLQRAMADTAGKLLILAT